MAKHLALGLTVMLFIVSAPVKVRSHSQHPIVVYSQVIFAGPSANEVTVAGPDPPRANMFGVLGVVDFPLTENINSGSPQVGRFQAIRAVSSINGTRHLFTSGSIIFEHGKYRGSTLQVQGIEKEADDVLTGELSVTGGTDSLRFAKGYVILQTVTPAINGTVVDQLKIFLQD